VSPVIPTFADAWYIVSNTMWILALIATVITIVMRSRNMLDATAVVWILLVLLIPLLGVAAWWIVGYRLSRPRPSVRPHGGR
jgi:hypothetical protein